MSLASDVPAWPEGVGGLLTSAVTGRHGNPCVACGAAQKGAVHNTADPADEIEAIKPWLTVRAEMKPSTPLAPERGTEPARGRKRSARPRPAARGGAGFPRARSALSVSSGTPVRGGWNRCGPASICLKAGASVKRPTRNPTTKKWGPEAAASGPRGMMKTVMRTGFLLAGWKGLEPSASGVTGRRYNQLNYHPMWCSGGRNRARTCDPRLVRPMLFQLSYPPSFLLKPGKNPALPEHAALSPKEPSVSSSFWIFSEFAPHPRPVRPWVRRSQASAPRRVPGKAPRRLRWPGPFSAPRPCVPPARC